MSLSDRTLRRLAWATWWFLAAVLVACVPIGLAGSPPSEGTWGPGGDGLEIAFNVVILIFPLTGLMILIRAPRNTIGWVLQGVGVAWGVSSLLYGYAAYGLVLSPGSLPRADVAAALNEGAWAPWIGLMGTFLILLFPDGHLPSPRWRPVAWLSAVTIVAVTVVFTLEPGRLEAGPVPSLPNPLALEWAAPILEVALAILILVFALCIVASAAGLVGRFRGSRGVERQQLKWLATAGALVAARFVFSIVASSFTSASAQQPAWLNALDLVGFLALALLPISIGIAILRHGLYSIDVVINRALVYGGLTVTLAGVYLGSVLVLQLVLSPLTSQSDLAVAASTLAVAALFGPVRGRIQAVADRRFFRQRYDAARTVESFSGRLRHEVDLESVSADLRGVVSETVQPTHVSLWLRS